MKKIITSLMAMVFVVGISGAAQAQGNVEKPQAPATKVEAATPGTGAAVDKTKKEISGAEKGKTGLKATVEKTQPDEKGK
jgi:hypothetical protein